MQTHAYSSTNADKISTSVTSALKSFCSGGSDGVINGVGTLLSEALTIFLGDGDAEEDELEQYYVLVEHLAIVRVDVKAWYRSVNSASIRTHAEKVSAFVAVKSSVDLTKVGFNSFLAVYGAQLSNGNLSSKDIETELEAAQGLYEKFHASLSVR